MDTVGMVRGLARAGHEVAHFYAQASAMGVGEVSAPLDTPSQPLPLGPGLPGRRAIEEAFRQTVRGFRPDAVIVTDSWTTKALLAWALAEHPCLLRFHGLEGSVP